MKKNLMLVGLLTAAALLAQGPPGRGRGPGGPGGPGGMMPMGRGMAMGRATVTGSPFSAVQVTESSQTLANGNVITERSQSNIYRDGMGRVRTEQTFQPRPGGAQAATTATPRTRVSIHDPVAGVTRELDPAAKTAHETPVPAFRGGGAAAGMRPGRGANPAGIRTPAADPNVVTETLAMQTINGVQATGTRVTRTIPAGAIGNAQAIQIVHEMWMSVDLKLPVLEKSIDPRSGTRTTQLTNITRSEPDSALFQAPSDYTVTRGRGPGPAGMRGPRGGQQ